jgi:hypothetical protein
MSHWRPARRSFLQNSYSGWCTPVILVLRKLKQEAQEFQPSLGYGAKPYLKKENNHQA